MPANFDGEGCDPSRGDVCLDLDAGIKGEFSEGLVLSCFGSILKGSNNAMMQEALRGLQIFIDLHDSHGNAAQMLCGQNNPNTVVVEQISIAAVFAAIKSQCLGKDEVVLEKASLIFDGMLQMGTNRINARQEAKKAQWIGRVAVIDQPKYISTNTALFDMGACAVVFIDGNNMGVLRNSCSKVSLDDALIREVVKAESEDWFFHRSGFLVAHGTRKAQAAKKSGVDPIVLAATVNNVFKAAGVI